MKSVRIIAELGNTHEGSVGLAMKMIEAAANSGADIVKLQTHIYEAESLPSAPNPPYFQGESRKEYFERTAFNFEQYESLKAHAESCGVELISSPFSTEALSFLLKVGIRCIKIPSGEVSNDFLLQAVAAESGLEILMSSGMSSMAEIDHAVGILGSNPKNKITLLQCTSKYPCPPDEIRLHYMAYFKEKYGLEVGLSDHSISESIPAIAVYAGASVIEKHFTLSRLAYGSDAMNSLEPKQFEQMVCYIREAEALRGKSYEGEPDDYIGNMKQVFEKSLVYSRDLPKNHVLTFADLAAKKPGNGIAVKRYSEFVGNSLVKSVSRDTQAALEDISGC